MTGPLSGEPGPVGVTSHSFSKNTTLRAELTARYPAARFNETGRPLEGDELVRFLKGCERAIVGLEVLNEALFAAVPELRLVSKYGVGLDGIDIGAARRRGVRVRWTPGVNRQAVAELTVGLMIAMCRELPMLTAAVRAGGWPHHRGGRQLSSATVGVIGCGNVGQQVVRLCRAFGASVLVHDIRSYDDFYRQFDVAPTSLSLLLQRSDIVSLHVPLDDATRGMIGARELQSMKPSAFFLNIARGGLVDEGALKDALASRRLAGAACDVFADEPPNDPELLALPNFVATPHVGGGTVEAVLAMGRAAIAGLGEAPGTVDVTASNF